MKTSRKEFLAASAAFAVSPMLAADGRRMKTPLMLDTKRMAIWDGPGIRTTFFVKGCPLKCIWCHNPESIKPDAQWARFQHLCKHHEKCTMDEATCPTRALKLYGKPMTIDEIVAKALEDKAFYDESGGGVTLSGGEPLFFWEWAAELFKAFKQAGLHTCLDTSGCILTEEVKAALAVTDRVLLDVKYVTDADYRQYVGCSLAQVLDFLAYLDEAGIPATLRQVIIPTLNDTAESVTALRDIAAKHPCVDGVELLPFRKMCQTKYDEMGLSFPFAQLPEPAAETMAQLKTILQPIL